MYLTGKKALPFSDTMLIHAQRKGASACASLEDWNEKVGRWVKRGAKGIALFDDSGTKLKLKYVFDVSARELKSVIPAKPSSSRYSMGSKPHRTDSA